MASAKTFRTTRRVEFCDTDADCQKGNDAGRCAQSALVPRKMDGSMRKACLCTVGAPGNQCPVQPDAGIVSFCHDGVPGEMQYCVGRVVCNAPQQYLFGDPDAGVLADDLHRLVGTL